MHQLRKSTLLAITFGAAVTLFIGTITASAQNTTPRHRETNASREARIRRTILDTYSHRYEVFGGGGYLRWKSGDNTQRNNEVNWAATTNYFLDSKLSIIGQAQGSFGNAKALRFNGFPQIPNPQINEYFFMGGPSYRFYAKQKMALSAQATGGVAWGIFSGGSKGIPSTNLGLWPDGWRPSFSLAVSGDYNFYPNLAFRVTPTYLGTTFGGEVQSNFGFNAGILYRFGRR